MDEIFLPPVIRHPIQLLQHVAGQHPWHVLDLDLPDKHWGHTRGKGVVIGVADTGLDENHPEIRGRVIKQRDFTGEGKGDQNAHGTHCTTTIAGKNVGVAPECRVLHAKVLGERGSGSLRGVADGIRWMIDEGADWISLSLGSPHGDSALQRACNYVRQQNRGGCAATGNESNSRVSFPAGYNSSLFATGAVNQKKQHASFSNTGPSVDGVCYGVQVTAGVPGGGYQSMSGTSMATPMMSGVIALRMSAELEHLGEIRTRTIDDWKRKADLFEDLGRGGHDTTFGWGFPDLDRLLYDGLDSPDTPLPTDPVNGETSIAAIVNGQKGRYVFVPNGAGASSKKKRKTKR